MKILNEYVRLHASYRHPGIIKVDSFLNHQIDTYLMKLIGHEFASHFCVRRPTKVLTLEASGIAPALATAFELGVPLVFAKKDKGAKSKIKFGTSYYADVVSFTGGAAHQISVESKYITASDRILVIDDFLATGAATLGLMNICEQAKAELVGIGAVIEKTSQGGRDKILSEDDTTDIMPLCQCYVNDEAGNIVII